MRMRVIALSQADWEAWIADQNATFTPGDEGAGPGPQDGGAEGGGESGGGE